MPNVTYKSCYYLFILQSEKFSHVMPSYSVFFIDLFRFVAHQISFKVLVFGPAGPDIEPSRCPFNILVF